MLLNQGLPFKLHCSLIPPFNSGRWLTGNIVNYAVNVVTFIYNSSRNLAQKHPMEFGSRNRGHKIKLKIVRESDAILREEIKNAGLQEDIWQYFTVLPGIRSVGVMGDGRTYDYTIGIRAVTSIDGMTADFAQIPWDVLSKISTRIVDECDHINRVVYDITSKPPSTIEWE